LTIRFDSKALRTEARMIKLLFGLLLTILALIPLAAYSQL